MSKKIQNAIKNRQRYNKVFMSVFNVKEASLLSDFTVKSVVEWDSITHIILMTELEKEFDINIMLDSDEILEFVSYEAGKSFLSKYNIII